MAKKIVPGDAERVRSGPPEWEGQWPVYDAVVLSGTHDYHLGNEPADLSSAKWEALQSGKRERDIPAELALCVGENLAGGLLPQQDIATVKDLISRVCQRERSRRI